MKYLNIYLTVQNNYSQKYSTEIYFYLCFRAMKEKSLASTWRRYVRNNEMVFEHAWLKVPTYSSSSHFSKIDSCYYNLLFFSKTFYGPLFYYLSECNSSFGLVLKSFILFCRISPLRSPTNKELREYAFGALIFLHSQLLLIRNTFALLTRK